MSIEKPNLINETSSEVYQLENKRFRPMEIKREEVIAEAIKILQNDDKFPYPIDNEVNTLKARSAIRDVLRNLGANDYLPGELEDQIKEDAEKVLTSVLN